MSDQRRAPSPPTAPALSMRDPLVGSRAGHGSGALYWLLDALRTRPGGRRALTVLSVVLVLGGGGLFTFPIATDVYATQVLQDRLDERLRAMRPEPTAAQPDARAQPNAPGQPDAPAQPSGAQPDAPAQSNATAQTYAPAQAEVGDPLTRIVIDELGVSTVVVEGTSEAALRAGAGHYPTTPLPGELGNVAIAGHRTTYGKPFNRIDELAVGDEIRLETPAAVHVYRVMAPPDGVRGACADGACWITNPNDWGVIGPSTVPTLTLTTCHPKGSVRQRLILRAELVETRLAEATP